MRYTTRKSGKQKKNEGGEQMKQGAHQKGQRGTAMEGIVEITSRGGKAQEEKYAKKKREKEERQRRR